MIVSWKHNQLLPTFDYTITVLNKLASRDTTTGKVDIWYATKLENCAFTSEVVRDVTGNVTSVGNTFICRIPKNDKYRKYSEWKSNPDEHFTLNVGDYIFLGELEEIVTAQNIQQVYQSHKDTAFQIKAFRDNTGRIELGEHYRVDGV